ncbi:MAG TPA: hypothetical protein VFJ43_15145 [Bacteroidia bacterium]|nr:hypothetical protein [Bacteroidia bacterium]
MNKILKNKILFFFLLVVFSFSMQSFRNVSGIQIEKRHYRKGYYVHICHGVKTEPIYTSTVSTSVKQEKPEPVQEQRSIQRSAPAQNRNDIEPSRSINNAPTSRAPIPSN